MTETTTTLAASALGRKSVEVRHKKLKEMGVDISTYYSEMRKKGINKRKKKDKRVLTSVR